MLSEVICAFDGPQHCADLAPGIVGEAAALLARIPPEFAVVLARDLLKTRPAFARTEGYKSFMKAHGRLLAR